MANKYQLVSQINLLPWREERREQLKKEFLVALMLVIGVGLVLGFFARAHHIQLRDNQTDRIDYVNQSIAEMDEKIVALELLEKVKANLLDRIRAIEELQSNRPLAVRMLDELVMAMPDGMNLTSLNQDGDLVAVTGLSESNAGVSAFMRNLDSSDWLQESTLRLIVKKMSNIGRPEESGKLGIDEYDEQKAEDPENKYVVFSEFKLSFRLDAQGGGADDDEE